MPPESPVDQAVQTIWATDQTLAESALPGGAGKLGTCAETTDQLRRSNHRMPD
jgi:hypothetical protein